MTLLRAVIDAGGIVRSPAKFAAVFLKAEKGGLQSAVVSRHDSKLLRSGQDLETSHGGGVVKGTKKPTSRRMHYTLGLHPLIVANMRNDELDLAVERIEMALATKSTRNSTVAIGDVGIIDDERLFTESSKHALAAMSRQIRFFRHMCR